MADIVNAPVQKQEQTPTSGPNAATTPAAGGSNPAVSRDYLRGASYDDAAKSLSPDGGAALKYERSLAPAGGGTPTQYQKLTAGAEHYKVETEGKYGYEKQKDGSYKRGSEYGYVQGGGVGWGNRKDDLEQWKDAKDPSKGKERANGAVKLSDVTGVPEPELDKIASVHKSEVSGPAGTYAGTDVSWGAWGESSGDFKVENGLGKAAPGKIGQTLADPSKWVSVEGPYAKGQAGGQASAYAGIKGEAKGNWGQVAGDAKASARAYLGASGQAGITQDGASAEGKVGLGAEVKVTADGDYTSPELKVDGVSSPLTAGAGVHGEASAYAKAGAGGGAYLTRDKIGLWGSAGAAAAAEAKADVHGHLGPVAGQYEVGVMAGAGAGIEGGILYEDGKLTIGARAYAALGYGVTTGGKITIDLKQSYELGVALLRKAQQVGIQGAQMAFRAADADNDGKLSLNDAATHGSNAMKAGAESFSSGVDGVISAMDRDGDGKWDARKDIGAGVSQAGKAIHQAGKDLYNQGAQAVDGALKRGSEMVKSAQKAADLDGDGQLGMGDVKAGAERLYDRASKGLNNAYDAGAQAVKDAQKWGQERWEDAQKGAEAAYKLADRTGDGKLGLDDLKQGASEAYAAASKTGSQLLKSGQETAKSAVKWAGEQVDAGRKWAGERVDAAGKAVSGAYDSAHKTLDRSGDGKLGLDDARVAVGEAQKAIQQRAGELHAEAVKTYQQTVKTVEATYKRVYDAADVNRDGKVDSADAKAAVAQTQKRATELYTQATKTVGQLRDQTVKTYQETAKRASQAVDTAKKALDRTGDGKLGLDDVRQGASEAYAAAAKQTQAAIKTVSTSVQSTVKSAQAAVTQAGQTLQSGWNSASSTASSALTRFGSFTGLW